MSAGNLFHYFVNKRAIFLAVFEDEASDKAERMVAAGAADDPWKALLEVIDLLATPALEPLVTHLVLEAMVQAYRDPEIEEALSRTTADEQKTVAVLLGRSAAAGRIDPELDLDATASWVMALIASLYTGAATDPTFKPAEQLSTLRLILTRYLRGEAR
ncbi:TetR/AcrR family transcriptional regulator [Streptomyces anulatus]